MYLVKFHIGGKYTPGEIIDDLPAEKAEWLLGVGAIEALAPETPEIMPEPTIPAEEINVMDGIVDKPKRRTGRRKQ